MKYIFILCFLLSSCIQAKGTLDTLCISTLFDESTLDDTDISFDIDIDDVSHDIIYSLSLSKEIDVSSELTDITDITEEANLDAHINCATITPDVFSDNIVLLHIEGFNSENELFFDLKSDVFQREDNAIYISLNNLPVPLEELKRGAFTVTLTLQSTIPEDIDDFSLDLCFSLEASKNLHL